MEDKHARVTPVLQALMLRVQYIGGVVASLIFFIAILATLGVLVSSFGYPFELFTHLSVQICLLSFISFIIYALRRNYQYGVFALALTLFHLSFIAPVIIPFHGSGSSDERDYRLMVANVLYKNNEHAMFLDVVREQDPDIIIVVEGTQQWQDALQPLNAIYPYTQRSTQYILGGARIFLYSKVALETINIDVDYSYSRPLLVVRVVDPVKPFLLLATHPYPPNLYETYLMRNKHKETVGEFIQKQTEPLIVAGDLNNTVWSPHFQKFIQRNTLKNARNGFGWNPSWKPEGAFIKIPIDHILYKGDFTIHNFYNTRDIGSDHYPVVADFSV